MNLSFGARRAGVALMTALALPCALQAQEAQIRKALEQIPNFPKIDEVRETPVPGLYEVRYAESEIVYSDAKGEYLFSGSLLRAKTMENLTEARLDRLSAIAFDDLPLGDALVIKQGSGARRLAVFVDPNCGYCKRFERDLVNVKDVTVYAFLMPILGPDSQAKARNIWCSKDPAKAWRGWMIDGATPPTAMGRCDSAALDRNVEFGRKHRITGTPGLVFEDGRRQAGAIPAATLEKLLGEAARKS
jgi:thiol:disulfide interchange protein DsbC